MKLTRIDDEWEIVEDAPPIYLLRDGELIVTGEGQAANYVFHERAMRFVNESRRYDADREAAAAAPVPVKRKRWWR